MSGAISSLRMRIPYRELPPPNITIPPSATTLPGAVAALKEFLTAPAPRNLPNRTAVLTGAGFSVASGLADYRGTNGTYRVNKAYLPIFYTDFLNSHATRKRYWARSYVGWTSLQKAHPNVGHHALARLHQLNLVSNVVTQNVDSLHVRAHPLMPTVELHGSLDYVVCTSCRTRSSRAAFQDELTRLNPVWADFLRKAIASGALATEDPAERQRRGGFRMNPDGDVELPDAPYTTFRYPPCQSCLTKPPKLADGSEGRVHVDSDGALSSGSTAGFLKPAVVMFGEDISSDVKQAAATAIDSAGRLLVLGTSLATFSAWRLAKQAKQNGMPVAVVNIGGVRGEDIFISGLDPDQTGSQGIRVEMSTESLLPALVEEISRTAPTGIDHVHESPQTFAPIPGASMIE